MKIYKDLYWQIISPVALFRAWDVFKSDKRNKLDVIDFGLDLEKNIFDLYRNLKNETYKHGPYKGFWIHDPKLRRIHKATVRDRVLHHAIFNVLNPIFEPTFIPNSFSCRVSKGTHKGMQKVAEMLRTVSQNTTRPCFALKCDIRKFFDSVDQETLFSIICRRVKDEKVRKLLCKIISSYSSIFERERERERESTFCARKGIPIGNLTSQIFANIYMNEFDQFIKHDLKVKYYARYTDDFVIISNNLDYLKELLPLISLFLKEKLQLELHPSKVTVRKYHQGIDFLGYVALPHHIKLRTKTKKRILKKLREIVRQYKTGDIGEQTLFSSLQSYLGVFSHANANKLTEEVKNKFWFWLKE